MRQIRKALSLAGAASAVLEADEEEAGASVLVAAPSMHAMRANHAHSI